MAKPDKVDRCRIQRRKVVGIGIYRGVLPRDQLNQKLDSLHFLSLSLSLAEEAEVKADELEIYASESQGVVDGKASRGSYD